MFAPVQFLRGDDVKQAEFAMRKGSRSKFPCRFCYWQVDSVKPFDSNGQRIRLYTRYEDHIAASRTSNDYSAFALPKDLQIQKVSI